MLDDVNILLDPYCFEVNGVKYDCVCSFKFEISPSGSSLDFEYEDENKMTISVSEKIERDDVLQKLELIYKSRKQTYDF